MIYNINFYTTQATITGTYDQWEGEYTRAFASRDEAVKFAQAICKRKHFGTFNLEWGD